MASIVSIGDPAAAAVAAKFDFSFKKVFGYVYYCYVPFPDPAPDCGRLVLPWGAFDPTFGAFTVVLSEGADPHFIYGEHNTVVVFKAPGESADACVIPVGSSPELGSWNWSRCAHTAHFGDVTVCPLDLTDRTEWKFICRNNAAGLPGWRMMHGTIEDPKFVNRELDTPLPWETQIALATWGDPHMEVTRVAHEISHIDIELNDINPSALERQSMDKPWWEQEDERKPWLESYEDISWPWEGSHQEVSRPWDSSSEPTSRYPWESATATSKTPWEQPREAWTEMDSPKALKRFSLAHSPTPVNKKTDEDSYDSFDFRKFRNDADSEADTMTEEDSFDEMHTQFGEYGEHHEAMTAIETPKALKRFSLTHSPKPVKTMEEDLYDKVRPARQTLPHDAATGWEPPSALRRFNLNKSPTPNLQMPRKTPSASPEREPSPPSWEPPPDDFSSSRSPRSSPRTKSPRSSPTPDNLDEETKYSPPPSNQFLPLEFAAPPPFSSTNFLKFPHPPKGIRLEFTHAPSLHLDLTPTPINVFLEFPQGPDCQLQFPDAEAGGEAGKDMPLELVSSNNSIIMDTRLEACPTHRLVLEATQRPRLRVDSQQRLMLESATPRLRLVSPPRLGVSANARVHVSRRQ